MNLKRIISNPLNIFLFIWALILITFQLKIAYFFPSYNYLQYLYPSISILFFILGFLIIKFSIRRKIIKKVKVTFSKKRFKIFVFSLFSMVIIIILLNLKLFGMPPFFSFLGYDTYVYLEYGRFKGVLFALLIFIYIISIYATKKFSIFMKLFSIAILLLYVSRGNIIFSIIVYFFLLVYENKLSNKKLFILIHLLIIFVLILFQILGEFRTGTNVFYASLEIKEEYQIENSGLIWLVSYISMPFVNFLELTNHNNLFFGENIISRSLPAFMSFNMESIAFYKSILPNKLNTVSGYLANVYLDFGLVGIILYNFFLGILLSYSFYISKNKILKSVLITCIALLFFVDYFFYFTTILIIILSIIFNKIIFKRKKI